MPGRIVPLVSGEYYHLYSRGSEKRDVFLQTRDFRRFIQTLHYYQFAGLKPSFSKFTKSSLVSLQPLGRDKLVEIICYCLMPNHFHFLVRQIQDKGISIFMSQLTNSYTKYFNTKYKRVGPLFQGAFKAVRVVTDEQLMHLSRYIHLNPIVSLLTKSLMNYPWSSFFEYSGEASGFCSTKEVLSFFPSKDAYKKFLEDQIEYGTTLETIKHQTIDEDNNGQ